MKPSPRRFYLFSLLMAVDGTGTPAPRPRPCAGCNSRIARTATRSPFRRRLCPACAARLTLPSGQAQEHDLKLSA